MAVDLATAKRAAQKRGLTPPPEWSSHPDDWYLAWFQGGIDAGDPSILKDAGLWTGAEGMGGGQGDKNAEQGFNKDYMQSAPSSEWMGKRKPTPSELRRYAAESKQSEDYARFSDAQLSAWIGKSWDPSQGGFLNDYGDRVEKPTESGPMSRAAGAATGEKGVGGGGGGGGGFGGGGRGGGGATAPGAAIPPPMWSPLQDMLMNQGGFLRQYDPKIGDENPGVKAGGVIGGGGIWYQPAAPPPIQEQGRAGGNMATQPGFGPAPPKPVTPGGPLLGGPASPGARVGVGPRGAGGVTPQPFQPIGPQPAFGTSPLTSALLPYQGQRMPGGPLTDMLSPYQLKNKRPGSWF